MSDSPDEPHSESDEPKRRPSTPDQTGRQQGIPDAQGKPSRKPVIEDIAAPKPGVKGFLTQDQLEERQFEDMELDWDDEEWADLEADVEADEVSQATKPQKAAPMPVESHVVEATSEAMVPEQDLEWEPEAYEPGPESPIQEVTSQDVAPTVEVEGTSPVSNKRSANEIEEEQRRAAGRPKVARANDFEPESWASSSTRFDRREEGHGQRAGGAGYWRKSVAAAKRFWRGLSPFEMASLTGFIVIGLVALLLFRNLVHSMEGTSPDAAGTKLPTPDRLDLPIQGERLTLTSAESFWRPVQPGDIVKPDQLMLPQVNLTFNGSGFIRIFFRDVKNRIAGDSITEKVDSGQEIAATCSEGYTNPLDLTWYQAGQSEGWRMEIFEGPAADAVFPDEWRLLAEFAMSPHEKTSP